MAVVVEMLRRMVVEGGRKELVGRGRREELELEQQSRSWTWCF